MTFLLIFVGVIVTGVLSGAFAGLIVSLAILSTQGKGEE